MSRWAPFHGSLAIISLFYSMETLDMKYDTPEAASQAAFAAFRHARVHCSNPRKTKAREPP